MKWEKWWREDATRRGQPCHLLITSRSQWLEGPTQMRTVVVLRPQGIHQSTLRVWMMYDRTELTQFKRGSNCCKSRFCKVKSLKLSLRWCMVHVSESSKVNCLSGSLWGELLCFCNSIVFHQTTQSLFLPPPPLSLLVSALQTMLVWEDITASIAMVWWPISKHICSIIPANLKIINSLPSGSCWITIDSSNLGTRLSSSFVLFQLHSWQTMKVHKSTYEGFVLWRDGRATNDGWMDK